jgi:hypothetical protein
MLPQAHDGDEYIRPRLGLPSSQPPHHQTYHFKAISKHHFNNTNRMKFTLLATAMTMAAAMPAADYDPHPPPPKPYDNHDPPKPVDPNGYPPPKPKDDFDGPKGHPPPPKPYHDDWKEDPKGKGRPRPPKDYYDA